MGLWPYYINALMYGNYANEANLHTRTEVHGIVTTNCEMLANQGLRLFHL